MIKNEKYSHKSFTNQSLKHLPASEFSNTVIVGSCFAQEICTEKVTQVDIFPDDIRNVHFERSNMINVYIPPTCTTDADCSKHRELSRETGIINVDKDEKLSKAPVNIKTKQQYFEEYAIYKAGKN